MQWLRVDRFSYAYWYCSLGPCETGASFDAPLERCMTRRVLQFQSSVRHLCRHPSEICCFFALGFLIAGFADVSEGSGAVMSKLLYHPIEMVLNKANNS